MRRWHLERERMKRRSREREKMCDTRLSLGHWRKRNPWDCGKPRCLLCHFHKVFSNRMKEREFIRREIDDYFD